MTVDDSDPKSPGVQLSGLVSDVVPLDGDGRGPWLGVGFTPGWGFGWLGWLKRDSKRERRRAKSEELTPGEPPRARE